MANRLARETSPYLLQHADNPVDWYPWGPEALSAARESDRPILLSIGYSACHWCHVMERESFEDSRTAELMNREFINVKVDREERPDLDSVYMKGVQALTGRGGWPLTAFLTPDGRVFYGGTYFPPEPRHGMPAFRQVLEAVSDAYRNRRDEVERGSDQLLDILKRGAAGTGAADEASGTADRNGSETLDHAFRFLAGRFDATHGGFGPAPKFPQPTTLEFLLTYALRAGEGDALDMVVRTLKAMARGGIRDHLGGGFHRYSVDGQWLVPHFEKMLYDNGLLARLYLNAFQLTGDEELMEAAASTLDYILRDLRGPEGGFYAARDADSEGEEGLFYLWTPEEVEEVLGPEEARLFGRAFDVTPGGNFEGRNILHLSHGLEALTEAEGVDEDTLRERLTRAGNQLLEAREEREAPFRDEKVLVAWNAFVLRALAEAGAVLGRSDYLEAARANAAFLLDALRDDGRLLRSWKDGTAKVPGFLEDYAGLGNALLTLYEVTLERRWLTEAEGLANQVVELFWDESGGVFYDTARDAEALVIRPRDPMDNATPSGNSLAVELLLRASRLLGREDWEARALEALAGEAPAMRSFPSAFGRLLSALSLHLAPPVEVVLLGDPDDPAMAELMRVAHADHEPWRLVAGGDPRRLPDIPLLAGREARGGEPTAYVCRNFTCSRPLSGPEELREELKEGAEGGPGGLVP